MFVKLTPLDTVFIRDGRRFGVNEAHAADSIFPPPPSVMFGALRGLVYNQSLPRPDAEWFGDSAKSGNLRQLGPALMLENRCYFPPPADLIFDSEKNPAIQLTLASSQGTCTPLKYVLTPPTEQRLPKAKEAHLIDSQGLQKWLNNQTKIAPSSFRKTDDFFVSELRTLVGINPSSRSAEDGHLFSLKHVRLREKASLLSQWECNNGPDESPQAIALEKAAGAKHLKLGGEGRLARIEVQKNGISWPSAPPITPARDDYYYFKIYFATPAYFSSGSFPCKDTNCLIKLKYGDTSIDGVKLLAAAIHKPFTQGGFDVAKGEQKPMRRYIPAGSVFFCKIHEDKATAEQVNELHGSTIGDDPFSRAQGYGLAFIGNYNPPVNNEVKNV